jgi:uncharacterized membrane protein YccC
MIPALLIGFILGVLGTFVLILTWPARRPKPKRHLFSELKEGMDALASTRREPLRHRKNRDAAERRVSREGISDERDRVQYEWINLTGEER